jgi:membrane-bound lytic murein transglycosylase B
MVGMNRSVRVVVATVAGCLVVLGALAFVLVRFGGTSSSPLTLTRGPAPSTAATPVRRPVDTGASRSGGRVVVDPAWLTRTATAAGLPVPALRAYAAAELTLRTEQPGCHLGWNTLAGIGWIESQHGTIGGRALGEDGRPSTPILGPALDGSGTYAAIRSTPSSAAWHGDRTWEHAVGPLQFLASTWGRWGADGDQDGHSDPQDLDDAALAAGRYLCADGHDLATDAGWTAAVHSYNHDQRYVVNVANAASAYAARTTAG